MSEAQALPKPGVFKTVLLSRSQTVLVQMFQIIPQYFFMNITSFPLPAFCAISFYKNMILPF